MTVPIQGTTEVITVPLSEIPDLEPSEIAQTLNECGCGLSSWLEFLLEYWRAGRADKFELLLREALVIKDSACAVGRDADVWDVACGARRVARGVWRAARGV